MSWLKKNWKSVVNPINSVLDSKGLGLESGIDHLTGKSASEDAAAAAREARELELAMHNQNIQLQKDFAQHGIRWRVEDAKAAGIHPLAAVGAAGASYSPSIPLIDPLPSVNLFQVSFQNEPVGPSYLSTGSSLPVSGCIIAF